MSQFILEAHAVSKQYGRKRVINSLQLQLPEGGIHAVVGGNGAGKSTLFRILLGLVEPSCGTTSVLGCNSMALTPEVRAQIGYVNEDHALPQWMRVNELKAMQKSHYPNWCDATYQAVIDNFYLLPQQKVAELSRGERAGLALAMALAQKPRLLILDEPTLGLDVVAKQSFLESLLFVGANEQRTILYCSHNMEEVERIADTLVLMEQGQVAEIESPESFCQRIEYWAAEFEGQPPAAQDVPNLLQVRDIDGILHYMLLDCDITFNEYLKAQGATWSMRHPVSLDRAVNAYLTRGRHLHAVREKGL